MTTVDTLSSPGQTPNGNPPNYLVQAMMQNYGQPQNQAFDYSSAQLNPSGMLTNGGWGLGGNQ